MSEHPLHPDTARYAEHVNPAFVRLLGTFGYGRVLTGGRGMELWDSEERRYVDFLAGFGATSLGHNPPRLIQALKRALDEDLAHVIHVGPQTWAGRLGEALAVRVPALPMCMLSCSGGEAVEAAMKLARAATGRPGIVYAHGGFHGSGLGNLSVMGHARWREPFAPLLPECHKVPFGDLDALETVLKKQRVAAFLVEPIQAEAGVHLPPDGYLLEASRLCRAKGALFMLDEVQTGLGRTGAFCAFNHVPGLDPDVVVLGKGLGAGLIAISATLTTRDLHERAYGSTSRFDLHGSTYAGSALACRTALEVLSVLDDEDLASHAAALGRHLMKRLSSRLEGHPLVREVRGKGLLVGVELGPTGHGVVQKLLGGAVETMSREVLGQWLSVRLLERGYLCQPASQQWNVLKLTPPLVVQETQLDGLVDAVGAILDEYRSLGPLLADVTRRLGAQWRGGWRFG